MSTPSIGSPLPFSDDHRNPLPNADAHRAQRVAAAGAVQLVHCGRDEACPARAQWVSERDRAAIRIDAFVIVCDPEVAQYGEALRGKGLVQFDHVDLPERQPGQREHLGHRLRQTEAHVM